jgi:hypothetical protein
MPASAARMTSRPNGGTSDCKWQLDMRTSGRSGLRAWQIGRADLVSRSAEDTATDQIPYVCRIRSAARSPITTQVAIVFPVVMRGMIEASAMRRQSMP